MSYLSSRRFSHRLKQKGYGVLAIILMMAALVGVLSIVMSGGANTASMLSNNNTISTMVGQAGLIRSRILSCGTEYPGGNNGTAYRVIYPAATTSTLVSALTCPGSGLGLWAASDGVTMPTQVSDFAAWYFVNDVTSMRITVVASNTQTTALLSRVATLLGSQASVASSTLTWVISN